jgi:hypothetical protein
MNRHSIIPGIVLIGLGVFLLIAQTTGVGGEAIVAVIGAAFLVAYAFTRQYGFLVPGGIVTGLGVGIIVETQLGGGSAVLLGLGLGFISIYLVDTLVATRPAGWWPLIPGGILATIGVFVAAGQEGWLAEIARLWPLALIVIGAYVILVQLRRGRQSAGPVDRSPKESAHNTDAATPAGPGETGPASR